ncbi:unnamed protein product [Leptidea sinapis]|uniref:E3 SUMO-protein ligase NSE2 n=1 Tax=Leptidea sinapis TaxID=189913 RepID=A0A5E4PZ21_9NEOP|nr:unnamed protein product [Leptidea sinapis]
MAEIDLKELRKQCVTNLYKCTDNVSKHIKPNEKPAEYEKLKSLVHEYCVMETHEDVTNQALAKTKIDPITKKSIVDPVRNTLCGHIYEHSVIRDIIKKKKLRCPVAGCGNRELIQEGHLVSDDELRFRMTLTHHSTMLHERSTTQLDDTQ